MQFTYLLCAALMTAGLSFADHRKLSHDLRGFDPDATVDVIVQFRSAPTEAHHRRMRAGGASDRANLDAINGAVYTIKAADVGSLADDPNVLFITPDRPVHPMLDYSAAAVNATMALQSGYDGTGIGIAVIDSGIK